jgi:hypothetical protein
MYVVFGSLVNHQMKIRAMLNSMNFFFNQWKEKDYQKENGKISLNILLHYIAKVVNN